MSESPILTVGVDTSEASSTALRWTAREAARRGARVRVIHSYSIPVYGGDMGGAFMPAIDPATLRDESVEAVEEQLAPVRREYPTVQFEVMVEVGWPTGAIIDGSKDADLIVVGSHGEGPLSALFLGSVAHNVAHRAPCAAVLVPNVPVTPAVTRVLVGVDGSAPSNAALDWARSEAARWNATLIVAHVWDYPYLDMGPVPEMKAGAEKILRAAAASLGEESPVVVEQKLIQGPPAQTLIEESADVDLLVVGARGRGPIRAALLGSTSSYAIHHALCPVVVVHAPGPVNGPQ